jgi:hypothetical protein
LFADLYRFVPKNHLPVTRLQKNLVFEYDGPLLTGVAIQTLPNLV